jgi:hypothetical protein
VTSAAGEDDPPEFPEVTDIGSDIVMPFCQLFVSLVVTLGVPIFIWVKMGAFPGQFAMLLSMIYFPMGAAGRRDVGQFCRSESGVRPLVGDESV